MLFTFRLTLEPPYVRVTIYDENGDPIRIPDHTYEVIVDDALTQIEEVLLQNETKGEFNDHARQIGEMLQKMVFSGGIQAKFSDYYLRTRDSGERMRIELEIDETRFPDFAALPWEFLYMPARGNMPPIRFAADSQLVLCRVREGNPRGILPRPDEPLRIAIFTTVPIYDNDVGKEMPQVFRKPMWEQIRTILRLQPDVTMEGRDDFSAGEIEYWTVDDDHRIDLRLYHKTTFSLLRAVIRDFHPHLVHFIGHGELRDMGTLLLLDEDSKQYATPLSADILVDAFEGNGIPPYLVLLHACHGASALKTKGFSSIASQLLQAGVTTVVAMQYQIQISDVTKFAEQLYALMFRTQKALSLECAVQEIRQNRTELLAQPVIYSTISPSRETVVFSPAYRANHVYSRLKEDEKEDAKHLFSRLVPLREDNSHTKVKFDTLPANLKSLVQLFNDRSLISSDGPLYSELSARYIWLDKQLLQSWEQLKIWKSDQEWQKNNDRLHKLMTGVASWQKDTFDLLTARQLEAFSPAWQRDYSNYLTVPEHELLDKSREQLVQLRAQEELLARVGSRFGLSWLALTISLFLVIFVDTEPLPGNPAWRWRTILGFSVPYALFFASGITFGIEAATIMRRREESHSWYRRAFILMVAALFIWTGFVLFGWLARDEDFSTIALPLLIPSIVLAASYVLPTAARSPAVQQILIAGLGMAAALLLSIELVQYGAAVRPSTSHLVLILPTFVGLSAVLPFVWEIVLGRWYAHRFQNLEG